MVFTEQQLQVKKLVDVQQDIEIDALNDGVGALSTSMQNGFTQASNNFNDIQNSLAVMNSLSESRYNTLYDSVNILSNDMSNIASGLGDAISNVASDMINMNNGIQNQFYGMENDYLDRFNQVNTNIGDSINNFHNEISNDLYVNVFSADTMIYNVSATPVNSLTALGYDSNGKIIPVTVIANTNIQFPTSADYLYTDVAGTAFGGTADTAVSTNENLVTSHAVYNAVNDIWTDLNEFHNEVTNSFGSVQNSFNAVDSTFAGVQNQFNDVNNAHNALYQNVVDGFIDVWGNFDNVNNSITNMNSNIQGQFNDVNSNVENLNNNIQGQFNDLNNGIDEKLGDALSIFYSVPSIKNIPNFNYITSFYYYSTLPSFNDANKIPMFYSPCKYAYWRLNSVYQGDNTIECYIPNVGGGVAEGLFENHPRILDFNYIPAFNGSAANMFRNAKLLYTADWDYLKNMENMYRDAPSLVNFASQIPLDAFEETKYMSNAFRNCKKLVGNNFIDGQYILMDNVNMSWAFGECINFTINKIVIPKKSYAVNAFNNCVNLNGDVYFYPDTVKNNIFDPNPNATSTSNYKDTFHNCSKLASRNIYISSNIPLDTSNALYNILVNNYTGVNWTGRIYNTL